MAVAGNDLGGYRLFGEAELARHIFLDPGIDIGEGPDRAGDGAGGDLGPGVEESLLGALEFGVERSELQPERGRLGVNPVAAADGERVLMLEGAALERLQQPLQVGMQDIAGARQLNGEAGIQDIRGRQPKMQETRFGPDVLGDIGEKGDDVVLGFLLDLVNAGDLELRALADQAGRLLGDEAQFGLGVAGMELDIEPDLEFRLRLPDRRHLRAAITRNHRAPISSRRDITPTKAI